MEPSRCRCVSLATHGAAVLLGVSVCVFWVGEETTGELRTEPVAKAIQARDSDEARAWIEDSLRQVRESAAKLREEKKPLSVPELLKKRRKEADEERKELEARLDQIVKAARNHQSESDPAKAIRAVLRDPGDRGDDDLVGSIPRIPMRHFCVERRNRSFC